MKAVVLVGGEGTRLRPLTYTTPKQLLPIVEVPMLARVLGSLARHGVDEAVLSLGYRPDAFLAAFPSGTLAGVRLSYAVEQYPLDTAGAIRFAAGQADLAGTFVVVNGDVLTDLDVSALLEFHRSKGSLATISVVPVHDPSRFGVVRAGPDGRVEAFLEKPSPEEGAGSCINAGTYVIEPSVLERIPAGRPVSVERETFPALASEGALYALRSDDYWVDTGTPEAYLRANTDLIAGHRGVPPAPGAKEASPGVWVQGQATMRGAFDPPSYVGTGALIESGARVGGSVVGAGAVVEEGARVEGSVLLSGARVAAAAVVIHSVVGHRALVGRGAEVTRGSVVGDDAVVEDGSHLAEGRVPAFVP
ncbi:MAG TPA: mannose-1-phosphate guanylyltransferase [Acidimicrobiaceae bacterium]|nr:mannose-1-phosphate guanylyltransferase [Acidimicrobiaceae bacterium]